MSTLTAAIDNECNDGRFKLGNKGGPGNPFAGKVALLRKAVLEIVTIADIQDIMESLVDMAIEGSLQAAKLVLSYLIGKPDLMDKLTMMNVEELAAMRSSNGIFQEAPSTNGVFEELTPSTNGVLQDAPSANGILEELLPSTNGDFAPTLNRKQRRALRKAKREAKRQRNSPKPVPKPVASAS